jgi:hypothetical protein
MVAVPRTHLRFILQQLSIHSEGCSQTDDAALVSYAGASLGWVLLEGLPGGQSYFCLRP